MPLQWLGYWLTASRTPRIFRHVGCELERLIDGIEVRVWNKGNASIAAPDAMLDEIQAQCDAVIAAYGH